MALEEIIRGVPPSEKAPRKLKRPRGKPRGLMKKILYTVGGGLLVTAGGVAVASKDIVPTQIQPIVEPLQQAVGDLLKLVDLRAGGAKIRPEKGQPGAEYWFDLTAEQIRTMSNIPVRNFELGDKYTSTVSPMLQEKAKKGGYHLVYQADPNDTTGYSVLPGPEREFSPTWSFFFGGWTGPTPDIPFAGAGGVIKGYAPIPGDPDQKQGIYLILTDPTRNQNFIVRVEPWNLLLVSNLDKGPQDPMTEWNSDGYLVKNDYATVFSTFQNLAFGKRVPLEKLLPKNGFVFVRLRTTFQSDGGISVPTKSITDENGVAITDNVYVPRFGDFKQIEREVGKSLSEF